MIVQYAYEYLKDYKSQIVIEVIGKCTKMYKSTYGIVAYSFFIRYPLSVIRCSCLVSRVSCLDFNTIIPYYMFLGLQSGADVRVRSGIVPAAGTRTVRQYRYGSYPYAPTVLLFLHVSRTRTRTRIRIRFRRAAHHFKMPAGPGASRIKNRRL